MVYAVILAGGTGTRFWPFSRELEPKQLMRLFGSRSLLQGTVARIKNLVPANNIYIVTNKKYFFELKKQVENFNIPFKNIILEPEGKNTAPAIGLCARLIEKNDQDAILVVLPSDHYIKGQHSFKDCIEKAIGCAKNNFLVTVGVKPKSPSTGYGYIKISKRKNGYFLAEKFLEKPEQKKATVFFKDKRFFWNSGIFVWKASVFLEELKARLPELYFNLIAIKSLGDIGKTWHKIKPISVDHGIMEHSKRTVLIPADFFWSDVGSWDALNAVLPKNKEGNVIQADCLNLNSAQVSVFGRGNRLISVVGAKGLIIADTPDALLVCDKNKTQDVRKIVERLKAKHRKEHLAHATEKRPWGAFTVLKTGLGFKVKLVEIEPKKRLSLQRHRRRAEHWIVVSGCAKVSSGKKVKFIRNNQSIYIPIKERHRLENPMRYPLRIVEVQTGNYLEEDDIERLEDDFRR